MVPSVEKDARDGGEGAGAEKIPSVTIYDPRPSDTGQRLKPR